MPRWALALILIAGVGLLYVGYRVGAPARKPNVVFLVLDTLRHDRLGATRNGVPIAPFLTEFAKGGANFSHAIAPSSWTKPTLASLFTATLPGNTQGALQRADRRHQWRAHQRRPRRQPSRRFPEYLCSDAGYDNWGIQTNENGNIDYGFAQGFAKGPLQAFHEFHPRRKK
jgi:arylsulfatase A-like enzyme